MDKLDEQLHEVLKDRPERQPVHAALLRVDCALLEQLLRLPEGWCIRRIRPANDTFADSLLFVVEAPELPLTEVGAQLNEVSLRFTRHEDGSISADWDIGAEISKIGAAAKRELGFQ